ncbi:TetR family transcriptional regulator [Actinoplanes sp. NPDC049596]|uniref:TetR/AcrR family transcriptional regulator n=1 Tax=unclassified Actinoplanes TaxID=2626549 RepID=UPI003423E152
MEGRRRRVPALAPEERRAALIAATIPLLHEHGVDVSTRQIAQAAGVAEGTIFGVFETKTSLVVCSVIKALDPEPTVAALGAIDPAAPLRERLAVAADLVHVRFAKNAQLMTAARKLVIAAQDPDTVKRMTAGREALHEAIVAVIGADADRLRKPAGTVATLLLMFCGANTFGPFGDPANFSGAETVSLLLDGLLTRGAQ